jgi:hypothetical protein
LVFLWVPGFRFVSGILGFGAFPLACWRFRGSVFPRHIGNLDHDGDVGQVELAIGSGNASGGVGENEAANKAKSFVKSK